jgi:hypothetical protein
VSTEGSPLAEIRSLACAVQGAQIKIGCVKKGSDLGRTAGPSTGSWHHVCARLTAHHLAIKYIKQQAGAALRTELKLVIGGVEELEELCGISRSSRVSEMGGDELSAHCRVLCGKQFTPRPLRETTCTNIPG